MKTGKGKIGHVIQVISIIPLLILGSIILLLNYRQSLNLLKDQTKTELKNAAFAIQTAFNSMYPGDYALVESNGGLALQKGLIDITREYDLFDAMKSTTGYDISVYYDDTIILTTLTKSDGSRFIGSGASDIIMTQVVQAKEAQFYENIRIQKEPCYAYYTPLTNMDGSVVGMLCVSKPVEDAVSAVTKTLLPVILVILFGVAMSVCFIFLYTRKFNDVLSKLQSFISDVSGGNLNAELHPSVTRRNDEFGVIGRDVVNMQDSLRHMLEQDALTNLFNRHFGNRKLVQLCQKCEATGGTFSLALGDIDFFKKVNDTYGHDAGDAILKNVSEVFQNHMRTNGFVARWGGEEFLLVFDRKNMYECAEEMERILNDIRAMKTPYGEDIIRVTMTFGIAEHHGQSIKEMLCEADEKLYNGKTAGRNRIVI